MKFQIDFYSQDDSEILQQLGAKLELRKGKNNFYDFFYYSIEIKDFQELELLLQKVDKMKNGIYSAIISFDPPTIYLDN